jgi:hypothetical protein
LFWKYTIWNPVQIQKRPYSESCLQMDWSNLVHWLGQFCYVRLDKAILLCKVRLDSFAM